MRRTLDKQLAEFFESGVSILVGTRDERLQPEVARGMALRVAPDGASLEVWLPAATAQRTLAHLEQHPRVALCVSRAMDHRSVQVKGPLLGLRDAREDERALVERYRGLIAASWGFFGMAPSLTFQLSHWPCRVLRVGIETIFEQTPGPGAGLPLDLARTRP